MKETSVWQGERREYPVLKENIEREIAVIGGGIAGFLTALCLAEEGRQVVLIEADRLFSGTTEKTTAKVTCNQGNVYADLSRRYGKDVAALYYRSQKDGMQKIAALAEKYEIECDWTEADSYIFSSEQSERLKESFSVLREAGADCEWVGKVKEVRAKCALKMGKQFLFDPLKFLTSLPVHFEIYEHTRAVKIDAAAKRIMTDRACISAKTIVVATHYPIVNSHGWYFMKLRQSTSYTLAVKERLVDAMYLDEKEDGLSLRPYAGGTLIGGEDHRTGRVGDGGHFQRLEESAKRLFGEVTVTHRWCAEDVMTFDGLPMAGKYAHGLDGVYVVTGFQKWGMANSAVCADLLTDLVAGRKNDYAALFSPQRKIYDSFGDFCSNALVNVAGLFAGYLGIPLKTSADVPLDEGMVVWHEGKRRAVYRDRDGKLYVIGSRCAHMGCELQWNADTHTWDCPCHGSRYDVYGNILAEPTTKRDQ